MTAPVPDEVLESWADRWRYPLAVVHPGDLVDGILHGLELGLTAPDESARTLVAMGYFVAAEQLFAADKTLDALIEKARGEAMVEVGRRRSVLAGRGDRVGLRPDAGPDVESVARDDLPRAEKLLDEWETQIAAAENCLRDDLRARAAGLPEDRREAVEQCLAQSAFDAAEVLVRPDSDPRLENGPGTVPRRNRWPYSGYDLREVLDWYRTGEDPTAGFRARWRPHPDDVPAGKLIAAYTDLVDGVDENRALWFVRALDDVLEGGGSHSAASVGQAVRSAVAGLREPKLPVLGLPTPVPVWLSHGDQPPPDGFPRPALWLAIGELPANPPHRVAVVTADNIFELAARGPDGQRPSAAARRVALLRTVCSQLTLADVLPSARPDGGRWQIAWVMDLLGVLAAEAAIDILMHDTSGLPAAVGVAMRQLFNGDERLRELTADSLARWRTDLRQIVDFRAQVMAELTDEPEVSSVLYAALLLYSTYGMEDFDASQIEELINGLVDPASVSGAGVRLFPDLARVLEQAVATGLLTSEGESFSLLPGGLPRLLTSDAAATEAAARKAVQELTDQRARLADRLMLRAVQEAIDHLETNSFMAFRSMVTSLEDYRHTLSDELGDLVTEAISQFRQFDTYHQVAINDAQEQVTKPDRFDVAVLLVEIAQKRETRHLRIVVEEREPQPHPVIASRLLVSMAIDNLLSNARRAIMEADAVGGTVRLRVGSANGNTTIDVEDSGPGLPDEVRERILRGEPVSLRSGGGRGLPDAKTLLGYYGGTVQPMPEASDLGGAYFRISLPSASTDYSPHS